MLIEFEKKTTLQIIVVCKIQYQAYYNDAKDGKVILGTIDLKFSNRQNVQILNELNFK